MRGILKLKKKSTFLFRRLLLSFLLIILLLASFNILSFTYFRTQIREEIIRYNTQNLNNTTDSFETHFNLVIKLMYSYYYKDRVQLINKPDFSYEVANQLRSEISNLVSNELLYLENFFLVQRANRFVLGKDGSSIPETLFEKFYASPKYPFSFWEQQFKESFTSRIYPAASFTDTTLKQAPVGMGTLFPVVTQNRLSPDLFFVTFLKADSLVGAFHQSINEKFVILNAQYQPIYKAHSELKIEKLSALDGDHGYFKQNGQYYFYQKGGSTGLVYMNIVPDAHITSAISRLNATLFTLLVVAIAVSIATSIYMSYRFNNPVQRIVESIRRINSEGVPERHRADEFELIGEAIHHMEQVQSSFHTDMAEKNSLLRSFVYMNKLKGIPNHTMDGGEGAVEQAEFAGPFRFVLFQIEFRPAFERDVEVDEVQATFLFREYIRKTMLGHFPDSHTFQIENNQILSIVYGDGAESRDALEAVLAVMRDNFETDRESCFFTIAVSDAFHQGGDYTKAYEQTLELIGRRQLRSESQLIWGSDPVGRSATATTILSEVQTNELATQLQAGQAEAARTIVQRIVLAMQRKDATAAQLLLFAEDVVEKTARTVAAAGLQIGSVAERVRDGKRALKRLQSVEELTAFMDRYVTEAAEMVRTKREERDPITDYVREHLAQHYREDITLEIVAEKLNITGGYLSTYFKEKTGSNFLDYVHEVRIGKACELLLRTDQLIQDIADQVGYTNLNTFNRTFKKVTGRTPREYRLERKQQ
ncbi:helix-turn-helix domain-containing protein [Paenibacillus koleovorans]|uniref:helix-turn-helix domain-containing protein n=1 Tax=Paenibacillus koleovorans TaxID=121608 RepID=UPI000FDA8675|nr:AraC family transcriptional regulator [Paenibacillus koleovorans]